MIKLRFSRRLLSFVVLGITLSAGLAVAAPSRPLKVLRFRSLANHTHAFIADTDSQGWQPGLFAEESVPEGLASSPLFYLATEPYAATVPIHRFRAADGSMRLAANDAERAAFRTSGLEEVGQPVYVYVWRVEGASEIYRLSNPQNGDIVYSTSSDERDYYLRQGWIQQPSLGFTQATSSSGTGILRRTTVKLEQADLSLLSQPVKKDGKLVFSTTNAKLAALAPETVLYSEKSVQLPLGLIAKVKSVSQGPLGTTEVETTPATLADAFVEYHIFIDNRPVYFLPSESDSDQPAATRRPVSPVRPQAAASDSVGGLLRADYLEDAVYVEGAHSEAAGQGTWTTNLSFDKKLLDQSCCTLEVNAGLTLSLTGEVNLSFSPPWTSFSGEVLFTPVLTGNTTATATFTAGLTKDDIPLLPSVDGTFFPGGIPVTVSVDLVGGFGITGSISGTVSGDATLRATGGFSWDLNLLGSNSFSVVRCPPSCPSGFSCGRGYSGGPTCSLTATGSASFSTDNSAYVYVEPKVGLGPGISVAGFSVDAEATVGTKYQLEAKIEPPDLNIYAELIPEIGAGLAFGPWTWTPVVMDLPELSTKIWQIGKPVATTQPATAITSTTATLNGTVNPNGAATQYWFLYATNPSLSGATKTSVHSLLIGTSAVAVSANISGLAAGTTYYFQLQASNFMGTGSGSTQSFTTVAVVKPPTVTTGAASGVTATSATLAGTVNPNGAATQFWFLYATNSSLSGASKSGVQSVGSGTSALAISASVAGLAAGTTYYYQLQASNSAGTSSGGIQNFTTPPAISTVSPNPMTGSSSNQTLTITGSGFRSGLTLTVGYTGFSTTLSGAQITSVTSGQVQALINVGTTARQWWVTVNNPGGLTSNTAYWNVVAPVKAPTVTTGAASSVTASSATLAGTVNPNGAATQFWFLYATNSSLSGASKSGVQSVGSGTSALAISASVAGLAAGTTYYYQLQASNSAGTSSGGIQNFTTPPAISTVSPNPMTGSSSNQTLTITGSGFRSGLTLTVGYTGFSTTLSGAQITSVTSGQVQALINVGTTARQWWVTVNNPGGLTSNTAYWNVVAPVKAPTVTTGAASSVTASSATLAGTVNPNGAATQFWFLYATNSSLSGASKSGVQSVGSGTSALAISASVAGLAAGTTYYYQLQASNSAGTSSGGIQNFTTPPAISTVSPNPMTGSSSNQTLTITGSGFRSGLTLTVGYTGFSTTLSGAQITSVTSGQVQALINVGTTARQWWVTVNNPGGLTSNTAYWNVVAPVKAPTVTTGAASSVTASSATLAGTVNPNGAATQFWFLYATNSSLSGASKSGVQSVGSGTSALAISASVAGLAAGTTYYYQLQASNSAGTSSGGIQNFTTPPAISTVSPNPVTGSSSPQAFTIYGAGFNANTTVTLGNQWNTYPNRPISSRSATQLVIYPTFGTTPATWWVQVTNGSLVSNQYSFQVLK